MNIINKNVVFGFFVATSFSSYSLAEGGGPLQTVQTVENIVQSIVRTVNAVNPVGNTLDACGVIVEAHNKCDEDIALRRWEGQDQNQRVTGLVALSRAINQYNDHFSSSIPQSLTNFINSCRNRITQFRQCLRDLTAHVLCDGAIEIAQCLEQKNAGRMASVDGTIEVTFSPVFRSQLDRMTVRQSNAWERLSAEHRRLQLGIQEENTRNEIARLEQLIQNLERNPTRTGLELPQARERLEQLRRGSSR